MRTFSGRQLWEIFYRTCYEWNEDKVPRMAAAVAFYTVFSIAPIVLVAFKVAEMTFGAEVALREMLEQAALLIGEEGADGIRLLIQNAPPHQASGLATALGLGLMIFAATGVFTELKDALNTIWEVQPKPGLSLMVLARDRLFAFAMVLVIWFLMLTSLVMGALLAALSRYVGADFLGLVGLQLAESVLSLLLTTLLFALIYRFLPDVHVAWRDVWLGAAVTAALFVVTKLLFGLYLGHSTLSSSYGAAGSLVIIILWTYCTCLVLLFGAEMSQVHAQMRHARIEPTEVAVHVTEHHRVQQGIPHTEEIEEALALERGAPADGNPLHLPPALGSVAPLVEVPLDAATSGASAASQRKRPPKGILAIAASIGVFLLAWMLHRRSA